MGREPARERAQELQVHVSRLRKELAPGVLVTREHGYELQLDVDELDAHRFEALLEDARGELAAGHPDRALAALERRLPCGAARRSPISPTSRSRRPRSPASRVSAIEQSIEAKLELGRHGEVIAQLEQLVEEHPYREALHAQLMLALYRADQADALAYQNARLHLVEDLGIEPGRAPEGAGARCWPRTSRWPWRSQGPRPRSRRTSSRAA